MAVRGLHRISRRGLAGRPDPHAHLGVPAAGPARRCPRGDRQRSPDPRTSGSLRPGPAGLPAFVRRRARARDGRASTPEGSRGGVASPGAEVSPEWRGGRGGGDALHAALRRLALREGVRRGHRHDPAGPPPWSLRPSRVSWPPSASMAPFRTWPASWQAARTSCSGGSKVSPEPWDLSPAPPCGWETRLSSVA